MAIRKLNNRMNNNGREVELRKEIVDELRRREETEAPSGAPVIYMEESGTPDNYTHWYAVWDRFEDIDHQSRSRILLDAILEVLGSHEGLRVTVAMGLTPEEAKGMGLEE